jgi:hypothetical protein
MRKRNQDAADDLSSPSYFLTCNSVGRIGGQEDVDPPHTSVPDWTRAT